ncbi:MAG: cytochrome c biogenesis CcdA family protein [Acidimicrobiales bacterium]
MSPAAITADPIGVLIAFGAGILSFVSPCVLPLVPGYVSMVSGLSAAELGTGTAPRRTARSRRLLLQGIGLFVAGFTVVFVALGAAASGLGEVLGTHKAALTTASGVVVVVLGAVLLVGMVPSRWWSLAGPRISGRLGWLVGERKIHVNPGALGVWAAPVMGMAFAFAWTPCIGPVLAAVLGLAAARDTMGGGVLLLFAYSVGLGVPFLVAGLAFDRLTTGYGRARRRLWVVQVLAGAVLVAFGVLLLTGHLGWLSAQFSALLDHLGLQRLAQS